MATKKNGCKLSPADKAAVEGHIMDFMEIVKEREPVEPGIPDGGVAVFRLAGTLMECAGMITKDEEPCPCFVEKVLMPLLVELAKEGKLVLAHDPFSEEDYCRLPMEHELASRRKGNR